MGDSSTPPKSHSFAGVRCAAVTEDDLVGVSLGTGGVRALLPGVGLLGPSGLGCRCVGVLVASFVLGRIARRWSTCWAREMARHPWERFSSAMSRRSLRAGIGSMMRDRERGGRLGCARSNRFDLSLQAIVQLQ